MGLDVDGDWAGSLGGVEMVGMLECMGEVIDGGAGDGEDGMEG